MPGPRPERVLIAVLAVLAVIAAASLILGYRHQTNPNFSTVTIAGQSFRLEIAATPEALDKGLGARAGIPERGGMIFVFPEPRYHAFVMRDCPVPIDLLYLDDAGRILSLATMQPEPPRSPDELAAGDAGDAAYNARLRVYLSPAPTRLAIELRGGTLARLGVQPGDTVSLKSGKFFGNNP